MKIPTEIAYLAAHSNYSKTLSKADDSNVLASITYDDVTYNVQILADNSKLSEDTDTVKTLTVPGNPNQAFGMFDNLEKTAGATTAIDLISKKLIKNTKAYENKAKDRDKYLDYIDALFYNLTHIKEAFTSNSKDMQLNTMFRAANMSYHEIANNLQTGKYGLKNITGDF